MKAEVTFQPGRNPEKCLGSRFQRRAEILAVLALAALVLAVYAQAAALGFVFDDFVYFGQSSHAGQGLTPAGLRWALTANVAGNWHPLTLLSLMLDVSLFGASAAAHHVVNVALHLANTLLLLFLLKRMTGRTWRSAAVAALFAAHPLHVESVAWIAERKDLLSALFGLLALDSGSGMPPAPALPGIVPPRLFSR